MPHNYFLPENYNNVLANATKFSEEIDTERLEEVILTIYSSHAGTLNIFGRKSKEEKHTARQIDTFGYLATTLEIYRIEPSFKFIQAQWVNDGTNTTIHEVTTTLKPKKLTAILVKK